MQPPVTSAPAQPPDDDDEAPTARRTPRKARFIQQVQDDGLWGWTEAVCGGNTKRYGDE